jgi:hypothetical protein
MQNANGAERPGSRGLAPAAMFVAGLVALLGTGCLSSSTLQGSSESSSDSSGSGSRSSASSSRSSSGGDDERAAYHRDVRDYAATLAASQPEAARVERDLGAIAHEHGVLDWERDDETYRDIGSGLADAGVGSERLDALADSISGGSERRRQLIEEGFAAHEDR